jgi:hypothetical protein
MTAEVAILNTHGVALAADSAVTVSVGGEKKVYNTANKLFALSKYHPVGIMVYNKATYMDIDWEIIIKEFRKYLKNDSRDTLFEYADSFIDYVKKFTSIEKEQQKGILFPICYNIIYFYRDIFIHTIKSKLNSIRDISLNQATQILNSVIKNIITVQENTPNKANYTFDVDFLEQYKNDIYKMINEIFEEYRVSIKQKENLFKIVMSDLIKAYNLTNYAGIVITGYGNKEIFPSIYQCEICGQVGRSFILFNERKEVISYGNRALIVPFAQKEMVYTFMEGIDPIYQKNIEKLLGDFALSVSEIIGSTYKNKLIKAKDELIEHLYKLRRKTYVAPIMDIVHSLQKSDLAEMAETLVNLTAFKRHVSKNAETVGGPTDVAIITKGDGFVWIKRKHYFDIKLNRFFQQNYFMEDEND